MMVMLAKNFYYEYCPTAEFNLDFLWILIG